MLGPSPKVSCQKHTHDKGGNPLFVTVLLGISLIAASCGEAPAAQGTNAPSASSSAAATATPIRSTVNVSVAVNITPDFSQVPQLVAEAAGYFTDANVTVSRQSTSVMPAAMTSGSVSYVALQAASPMIPLRDQGSPAVAFCQIGLGNANILTVSSAFVKNHNIPVTGSVVDRVKAMKGARFAATAPTSGTAITANYLMSLAGYKVGTDYSISYLNSLGAFVAAMQKGDIDAFVSYSPSPELLADQGVGVVLINIAAEKIPAFDAMTGYVLWALQSELTAHPDAARATCAAFRKGVDLIRTDLAKAKQLVRPTFKDLSDVVFEKAFANAVTTYAPTPTMTAAGFAKAIDLFRGTIGTNPTSESTASLYFTNDYTK